MKNKKVYSLISFILLIMLWWFISAIVKKDFIPNPYESLIGFFEIFETENLVQNFLISLYRIFVSFLISLLIALPLGVAMGRIRWMDSFFSPIVNMLYPIPKIVFLPIFVVFLGLGNAPKILIISLIVFFQILVIIRDGVKKIPESYFISFRTMSQSNVGLIFHVILPAIVPDIITSLRVSVGSAIAVLFFAETFAAQDGLGYVILDTMEARNYNQMYGGIIAMSILGISIYELLSMVERKITGKNKSS
nr:ABC transporter permease subunit [uncultured Peptostreptococcus sp.]